MTDADAAAAALWDGLAPQYIQGGGQATPALMDQLLLDLPEVAPSACLDLACGPGRTTQRLAQAFPGADVLGVDLSPVMLEQARLENPGLRFAEGRDTAIPVADASQDFVFCNLGLMLFPEPAPALAEIARVLRPGGELRVGVWGRPEHTTFPTFAAALAKRLGHPVPEPPRSNFHLGEPSALRAAAAETRLDLRSWRRWALRFPYASAADACVDLGLWEGGNSQLREPLGDAWDGFLIAARASIHPSQPVSLRRVSTSPKFVMLPLAITGMEATSLTSLMADRWARHCSSASRAAHAL